jgi:hypothetical protein
MVRAQYWLVRGEWTDVLDADASEFRRMARTNPEVWAIAEEGEEVIGGPT